MKKVINQVSITTLSTTFIFGLISKEWLPLLICVSSVTLLKLIID